MTGETGILDRNRLLDYFLQAATPREAWQVGMEVERMGRARGTGAALAYEGEEPSVRAVLEFLRDRRGGAPVTEGDHLIGVDGEWGTISLEPGGQVEWSSRPQTSLDDLGAALEAHETSMRDCGEALAVRWLEESADPEIALDEMPWMPKARYGIMRPYLGDRGRLAHRMMTQTASIQCAFDYADPADFQRKFKVGALLSPVATALFANSSRLDGKPTGFRSYRYAIWRETDPDRCGLPARLFDLDFRLEAWLDYVLDVPAMLVHRARGLIPAGGVPFRELLDLAGCTAPKLEDWETHLSTVFTDVRCYTYIEVRSADLPPAGLALAVPSFWTGIFYHPESLDRALELGREIADHAAWDRAMLEAARHGLEGRMGNRTIGDVARQALGIAARALEDGAACAGTEGAGLRALERLAEHHRLEPAL